MDNFPGGEEVIIWKDDAFQGGTAGTVTHILVEVFARAGMPKKFVAFFSMFS